MGKSKLKCLNILTILLSAGVIATASAGIFIPDTYSRETASMAAQGTGQDIVDLFIVVPVLLISLYYANRNSKKALLVLGGTIAYLMYSYAIYSLGIHFNRFFLLYTFTFGLSLYSFIIFMEGIFRMDVAGWFTRAPAKGISVYLLFVASIFYFLWLNSIVPAIMNNTVPPDVSNYDLLVNPVHVLDLSFALPALIIGSIQLLRAKKAGYIITSLALVFMIILTIALGGMVIMLMVRNISEDYTIALVFGILTVTSMLFKYLLFRKIK